MQNKMKLLSCRKLWLYPAKAKRDKHTNITCLFKQCFSYKFKYTLKPPCLLEIDWFFFLPVS